MDGQQGINDNSTKINDEGKRMRIAIIGAGNVGTALGAGWHKVGHEVLYGVPNSSDEKYEPLKQYASVSGSREAARDGDLIVLATPWAKTQEALLGLGAEIEGKILVDCTNPLKPDLSGLEYGHVTSGGEQVAGWAKGAVVVKAFNTTGFNIMMNPLIQEIKTVMFVSSDSEQARKTVAELARDLNFEAVEFGELASARLLEPFALIWILMAYRYGFGRDFGFGVLRKSNDLSNLENDSM